ncbi:uncharacterized protein [Palaemon carinicauda]|uniref:uncharacterized protein n=1 Tax=Palaemon carinicauda TaxID=392227 RepID=UPI0035B63EF0
MVSNHLLLAMNMLLIAMVSVNSIDEEVWKVIGVAGRTSDLPCYLNPRTSGDRPKLILWYKGDIKTPIISSYDGRMPEVHPSTVHREEYILTVGRTAATLTINTVGTESAGMYECRVEFFKSPTHTNSVNLTVIVPPRSVEIWDSNTGPAKNGVIGQYYEGDKVTITCIARNELVV